MSNRSPFTEKGSEEKKEKLSQAALAAKEYELKKQASALRRAIIDEIMNARHSGIDRDELQPIEDIKTLSLIWRVVTGAGPGQDFWGPSEDAKDTKTRKDIKTRVKPSGRANRFYKYPEKLDPNYHGKVEPELKFVDFNSSFKYPEKLEPGIHGKTEKAS